MLVGKMAIGIGLFVKLLILWGLMIMYYHRRKLTFLVSFFQCTYTFISPFLLL
ncbi:MAG: hypothetical protein ACI35O_16070 [Bacillaceae bacterium]